MRPRLLAQSSKESAIRLKEHYSMAPLGEAFLRRVLSFWVIPVNEKRRESAISSEKETEALQGLAIVFDLPRGHASPDGRLPEFKKGAVVMAIKAVVPRGVCLWHVGRSPVTGKRLAGKSPRRDHPENFASD